MKLKYILLIVVLVVFTSYVQANEGFYFEAGISVHDEKSAYPEIQNMPNPLGNAGFGYTIKYKTKEQLDLYFKHTTSIPFTEDGYGLNQLGLSYRSYF